MKRHTCSICSIKDKNTKRVSFSLPPDKYAEYKKLAAELNMTFAAFVRHAIHEACNKSSDPTTIGSAQH